MHARVCVCVCVYVCVRVCVCMYVCVCAHKMCVRAHISKSTTRYDTPASKDFVTSRMDAFENYGETRNSTKYDVTVNIRSMLLRLVMLYVELR